MSGIKGLVGRRMTKKFKFMNEDVEVSKLNVAQIREVQIAARAAEKDAKKLMKAQDAAEKAGVPVPDGDDMAGIELIKAVIRMAVEGADDLSDEDFMTFPMDELSSLSNEIMTFSGVGADSGK